jgi:glycerol-3-phosphate acyltransferase PlsX
MRIVLDAMGSDTHPGPELEAAAIASEMWPEPLILSGPEDILRPQLDAMGVAADRIQIIHAPEVLEMTDKPARAARGKALNSMAVGMDFLKEGHADAFVTAGNTGGAMTNGLFRLGRIRGVKRPALAAAFPVQNGTAIALDVGANADCKPEYLLQFAIMGSVYYQKVFGIEEPRIGLLSNGEEAGKGNQLVKDTYPLLAASNLNFQGNVEAKEVFAGQVDVVVTDGFSGNVFLKTSEAVAKFLIDVIRTEIKSQPISTIGGLLAKPAFRQVGELLDPAEYGAAPLLGIDGMIFVGHGRSDAKALISAIKIARQAVENNVIDTIRTLLAEKLGG